METIYAITDYKGHFGSKWLSNPYRSGYNHDLLITYFRKAGFDIKFLKPTEIIFKQEIWKDKIVLLSSSEEPTLSYKSYIEDVAFGLNYCKAHLIPSMKLLQSHENKIKSIIIQNIATENSLRILKYKIFGNYEELKEVIDKNTIEYPCILKKPDGSKGSGVFLVKNKTELKKTARKISSNFTLQRWIKEKIRTIKHKGYIPNTMHPNKFMIQEYISNLSCDWKVLIYGSRIYLLKRKVKSNDFKASGSGFGYKSGSESEFPVEYLEILYQFLLRINAPNISIDFGYNNLKGFIFEFQAIYFGTSTQYKSKDYYHRTNGEWSLKKNDLDQENAYASSILEFIEKK